ncbi:FG-GAP repeat domain-containing protein [Streptomyces sp. URMC 126]|uniref:FG-GAP repeat domain-containing protein n=1 Tax=Streptomyces sp. URMC 126 TaxID=3423401 RepID=UPI003F1B87BD
MTAITLAVALAVVAPVLYFAPMPWKAAGNSPLAEAGSRTPSPVREDGGVTPPERFPATDTFWLVDLNQDRKAEYLAVAKDQTFRFWWNGGVKDERLRYGGKGENSYAPGPDAYGAALRFGDIDRDGRPDCMAVDRTGRVTLHTWIEENPPGARMCMRGYDGDVGVPLLATAGRMPDLKEIQFADIDGDGRVDYLWIEPSSEVTVWFNRGFTDEDGHKRLKWSPPTRALTTVFNREMRFADLDGDGRADPVLITPKGGARGWLNRSGAESGIVNDDICQIVPDTDAPPAEIRFADVDGDGKAEFLHIDRTGAVHVRDPELRPKC